MKPKEALRTIQKLVLPKMVHNEGDSDEAPSLLEIYDITVRALRTPADKDAAMPSGGSSAK
jgi:hypothetical protein